MAQGVGSLLPTRENWIEFLAPGVGLAAAAAGPSRREICVSLCSSRVRASSEGGYTCWGLQLWSQIRQRGEGTPCRARWG